MILGVTLAEAVRLVGHRRGTTSKELRAVLRRRGVKLARTRLWDETVASAPLPDQCIVRLSLRRGIGSVGYKRNWHWMLYWGGRVLDPAGLWPAYLGEITSYLQIIENKPNKDA